MLKKVNILGVSYSVTVTNPANDKMLNECDGYCDHFAKTIVVADCLDKDFESDEHRTAHMNKVFRHEVIHAFLGESGLAENSWARNEEIVDWFANMFPKLQSVFNLFEGG